jgi:ActR/RegA family two-component response regulator
VLWVDDDISTDSAEIMRRLHDKITGVELLTAKSCGESEKILRKRERPPQWAIVDLIVPQGAWDRNEYHRSPGIEYIKHLKNRYGDDIRILAFSIVITPELQQKLAEAGASEAFAKSNTSFVGILRKIQSEVKASQQHEREAKVGADQHAQLKA